jgi:nucleotide-binding universal stress UspA family protein
VSNSTGQPGVGTAGRPRIVVGVDGSPASAAGLRYALRQAARRGADLEVVTAYTDPAIWAGGAPIVIPDLDDLRADSESRARALVEEAMQQVVGASGLDTVGMTVVPVAGAAAHALIEASPGAALLVVGSRGRGALRSAVLGSVALHCVARAHCPVAVVNQGTEEVPGGPVVVGIDGSDASRIALRAGIEEATRLGTEVRAVAAFSLARYWTDAYEMALPEIDEIAAGVRHQAEAVVREVLAESTASGPGAPRVDTVVLQGHATDVLTEIAKGAALLVVGSHGHGTFRGLLLGSVALGCTIAAPCPVMVVPPAPRPDTVPAPAEPASAHA